MKIQFFPFEKISRKSTRDGGRELIVSSINCIIKKKMNKITLILDIDGVLIKTPPWRNDEIHSDGYSDFDRECVQNLKELLKEREFEIWLSSTRRIKISIDKWNEIFKNRGLNQVVEGLLPVCESCKTRKEEIINFIEEKSLINYLIIDDDKSLNDFEPKKKIVLTTLMTGFNCESLQEAKMKITAIDK